MIDRKPRAQKPTEGYDPEFVTDLSEAVYRIRLEDSSGGGKDAVVRMLEKDNDGGGKLRGRASAYDPLTRAYLAALGVPKPNGRLA